MSQKTYFISLFSTLAGLVLLGSCANIGTPSGGPRDETPPHLVSANPPQGARNVDQKRISLTFDELINVKDAFSKVVVSPVAKSTPRVSFSGRRIFVDFDSLAPATTYTIDFADAIEDNNEGNKLQSFTYTFSTGLELDTLRLSGYVLGARNLEPQQSMLVGIHPYNDNLSAGADTAFTKIPFLRVAKTDDRGRFTIRGLAPGKYRVFALADNDNDYKYSSPEEDIAFYDAVVSPFSQRIVTADSIWNQLTGKLDTVISRTRTQFLPNDILLRSFNSGIRQQYLSKYERLDSARVFLKFNTVADSLPNIRVIGRPELSSIGTLEYSARLDSLVWWLTPELVHSDSLRLAVTYPRSNADFSTSLFTDTLNFFTKKLPIPKKPSKKKISAADSIAALTLRLDVKSQATLDVDKPLLVESATPIHRLDTAAIHLSVLVDTLYQKIDTPLNIYSPDPGNPRQFAIYFPWEYGTKYRLDIDTIAATDIYGKPSRPMQYDFNTKQQGDYCTLTLALKGLDNYPAFVELLNGSDTVVRTASVVDGEAFFPYLSPGKYYARIIFDDNENGVYDTGNYDLGLQPEIAYYYPKAINIKKNWDSRVEWNIFDTAVDKMKPAAILKNKPAADRRNRTNTSTITEEEEDDYFDPTRNPFDPNDRGRKRY